MGLFSSLFFSEKTEEDQQQKADHKKFDVLKYDGIRAQRFGKTEYALKCFTEALKYKEDFDIGSQIQAVSKRWNIAMTARITEIEESYDREGMSLAVIFGKPMLTLAEKLRGGI